jgi:hypothetical protein
MCPIYKKKSCRTASKKFVINLNIDLYALFLIKPIDNLGRGGCAFKCLKVVIQLRPLISLNCSNKVLFTI